MPLRMVRTVHQQPTYTARQPTSAYPARPVMSLGRDRSDPLHRRLQSTLELSEKLLPRTRRLHLTIQCRQLRFGQLPPLGIGKQPIETPRNMPHLEPHRRQSKRPLLQLLLREPGTPPRRILPRQFQSVQHPPLHHIVLRQCPAQPRFNHHSNLTPELFLAVHPPSSIFILFITVTPSIRGRPSQPLTPTKLSHHVPHIPMLPIHSIVHRPNLIRRHLSRQPIHRHLNPRM